MKGKSRINRMGKREDGVTDRGRMRHQESARGRNRGFRCDQKDAQGERSKAYMTT